MGVDFESGAEFAGHQIVAPLGRGGMGVVYHAVHLGLERHVALKVIAADRAVDPSFRERFRREARSAAALDHPGVITIYEAGVVEGLPYMTMRLVRGPDLGRQLRIGGPLAPEVAVSVVAMVADALQTAHESGLVHRDIKPANILLERRNRELRALLADFGLARLAEVSAGLTTTGSWLGTVDYAAPETLAGDPATAAADVYALGAVLHAALTGRPPFARETAAAVVWGHAHEPPPRLVEIDHPSAEALDQVIARAMAKAPGERFASAGELADAVRAAAGPPRELPLLAQPVALIGELDAEITTDPVAGATMTERSPAGVTKPSRPAPPVRETPAEPARRRRGLIAALAGAVGLITGVALFVLLARGEVSALDASRLTVDPIPVGAPPLGLATGDGTPWVLTAKEDVGSVRPIEDGRAGPGVALDDDAYAIAGSGADLWVTTEGGLARVDAETREAVGGPVDLEAGSDAGVAVGEGALWVTDTIDGAVIRADLVTARAVGEPIPVEGNLRGPIAAGEGAVWVLAADATAEVTTVTPIDPATNRPGRAIRIGAYGSAYGLAVGGGGVWVTDGESGSVRRIDPAQRRLDPRRVTLEDGVADVAFGSGAVWALDGQGLAVTRIDPATVKQVGRPVAVAAGTDARLAVSPGAAWVMSERQSAALRITWDD